MRFVRKAPCFDFNCTPCSRVAKYFVFVIVDVLFLYLPQRSGTRTFHPTVTLEQLMYLDT